MLFSGQLQPARKVTIPTQRRQAMSGGEQKESIVSQVVFWVGDWMALMAFWIVLTGNFRWTELLIGAGASLLGSIVSVAAESMNIARFLPHWRYLWQSRAVIWQMVIGVWVVMGSLIRHDGRAAGRVHAIPFDPGGEDAESQARRAVAETFPTMAPASVVIGVDRGMGAVVFHLLGTSSVPPTLQRLSEAE
jgi:multisubunit Na+/H+ antiporter MnhE subunit